MVVIVLLAAASVSGWIGKTVVSSNIRRIQKEKSDEIGKDSPTSQGAPKDKTESDGDLPAQTFGSSVLRKEESMETADCESDDDRIGNRIH